MKLVKKAFDVGEAYVYSGDPAAPGWPEGFAPDSMRFDKAAPVEGEEAPEPKVKAFVYGTDGVGVLATLEPGDVLARLSTGAYTVIDKARVEVEFDLVEADAEEPASAGKD